MTYTPDNIDELKACEIFVFGSNEAGFHGAGAARDAEELFGARMGIGRGLVGQTYAIATKDKFLYTLPLLAIDAQVKTFLMFAARYLEKTFLVTPIGCGLAGYQPSDIAPMFLNRPITPNVILPKSFYDAHATQLEKLRGKSRKVWK